MKTLLLYSLSFFIIFSTTEMRANNWKTILDTLRKKTVLIEYYEGIHSIERIRGKEKIKRNLSGFVVDSSGLIITSASIFRANLEFSGSSRFMIAHQKPIQIRVKFAEREYQPAEFVGKDEDTGLAFIRLRDKKTSAFLHFKKRASVCIGSEVLFLQHLPKRFDFQPVLRKRRINAVLNKPQKVFLCDMNPSPALTSFGLVLNKAGDAIGLLQSTGQGDSFHGEPRQSLARFILFERFAKLIERPPLYKEKKTIRKRWLGVYSQPFTRDLAAYFGQDSLRGVLINTVIEDSPAQKAGIKSGDVIVSLNGKPLVAEKDSDLEIFRQRIRQMPRPILKVKLFRAGKYLQKNVTLEVTPISQFLATEASSSQLGFSVKELTQDIILAKQLSFDTQGVWVSRVERAGWADVAGLRVGDLIMQINEKPVGSLQDMETEFIKIEEQKPDYVRLFIKRQSDTEFYFIKTNY